MCRTRGLADQQRRATGAVDRDAGARWIRDAHEARGQQAFALQANAGVRQLGVGRDRRVGQRHQQFVGELRDRTGPSERRRHCGPQGLGLGPGRAGQRVGQRVDAIRQGQRRRRPVAQPMPGAAAQIGRDQVEAVIARCQRGAEARCVELAGEPVDDQAAARRRIRQVARRLAHIGQQRQAAGTVQAQPGAAAGEVAPGQQRHAARLPPGHRLTGARKILVTVGGDDDRKA
mmetsp:Transcript_4957/g.17976  ORF Transcript_4957/g.17976 Transcript_4957/m.17976 type:complete len:231 (+) Transcript_4957:87-779(+)